MTPSRLAEPPLPVRRRPLTRRERVVLFLHSNADRWLSPLGVWVMRRTKGGMADSRLVKAMGAPKQLHVLLLTTRGRRSGKTRTVVLQFFPDGEAMIVAAANDGGRTHPGWYFNLTADAAATIEVKGRRTRVRAETLPEDEAATWWRRILEADPSYERYARATERTFPIVRLVPAADAPAVNRRETSPSPAPSPRCP